MPTLTRPRPKRRVRAQPTERLSDAWNVVLIDDDHHTYDYVVEMLGAVFGYDTSTAYRMAVEVDGTGRVIVYTGPRETAEFKQVRIHGYGADPRLSKCRGSMSSVLERGA